MTLARPAQQTANKPRGLDAKQVFCPFLVGNQETIQPHLLCYHLADVSSEAVGWRQDKVHSQLFSSLWEEKKNIAKGTRERKRSNAGKERGTKA